MKLIDENYLDRIISDSLTSLKIADEAGPLVVGDQQFNDIVQKFIMQVSSNKIFENIVKPILVQNLYEAEGSAAAAGEVFLRLIITHYDVRRRELMKNINWSLLVKSLNKNAKIRPTKTEIEKMISENLDHEILDIINNALMKLSKDDQIEVCRSFDRATSINFAEGCQFKNIKIDPGFLGTKDWSRNNVNVILVDGVIEKSIHIEQILHKSYSDETPYLIICREASDEVKNACLINFARKTTDVLLCTAPYTEKTAHVFEDLKIATHADVVCPELGDMITAALYKKACVVSKIKITQENINILPNDISDVTKHREKLYRNMIEINDDNVSDLIRQRIKTMSGRRAVISVGNDIILRKRNAIEQIDKKMRMIKDAMSTGILHSSTHNDITKIVAIQNLPVKTVKIACETYLSFVKVMSDTGLIIVE